MKGSGFMRRFRLFLGTVWLLLSFRAEEITKIFKLREYEVQHIRTYIKDEMVGKIFNSKAFKTGFILLYHIKNLNVTR